jgi:hypothetical protein
MGFAADFLGSQAVARYLAHVLGEDRALEIFSNLCGHPLGVSPGEWMAVGLGMPGTKRIACIEENMGALKVKLSAEDIEQLEAAVPYHEVTDGNSRPLILCLSSFETRFSSSPFQKVVCLPRCACCMIACK